MSTSIIVTSRQKNQAKRKRIPQATLLRKLVDPYIYGLKRFNHPEPYARKDTLQAKLNLRNYGCRWTTADFELHCAGKRTLYYYAKWSCHWDDKGYDEIFPKDCLMAYLDVDIQKKQGIGTPDDACRAMQILTEIFPGLYSEDNRRAYLFVYNDGLDRDEYKTLMGDFAKVMDTRLKQDCNIEKFEIKGTPTDIRRFTGYCYKVLGYGVLGKLPTQLMERFDEFYGSAVIKASDLRKLVDKLASKLPKMEK